MPPGRHAGKGIELRRKIPIGDVEVANLVDPVGRNGINNGVGKTPVGIEDGNALASVKISCIATLKRTVLCTAAALASSRDDQC